MSVYEGAEERAGYSGGELVILYASEILGMMGALLVRLLLGNTVAGMIVYILCSTGVYLIAIYVLTGTYMKRVLGMTRREGMPGCKADTLVTWGVTTICLQGVILVLTVPSVDKDTHASSGLITAFSASSSIGVRFSTPHSRFLETIVIRPTGGRRVRQRLFQCPARRLNDAYWTYAERKATRQDTETALS